MLDGDLRLRGQAPSEMAYANVTHRIATACDIRRSKHAAAMDGVPGRAFAYGLGFDRVVADLRVAGLPE